MISKPNEQEVWNLGLLVRKTKQLPREQQIGMWHDRISDLEEHPPMPLVWAATKAVKYSLAYDKEFARACDIPFHRISDYWDAIRAAAVLYGENYDASEN